MSKIQPTQPKTEPPAEPVYCMRFNAQVPIHIPGNSVSSSVVHTYQENRGGYRLSYLPSRRHFKVVWVDNKGRAHTTMVHESKVSSWDPEPPPQG